MPPPNSGRCARLAASGDRAGRGDPQGSLTRNRRDQFEVGVVVQHREVGQLRLSGDDQIRNRTTLQASRRELALRAICNVERRVDQGESVEPFEDGGELAVVSLVRCRRAKLESRHRRVEELTEPQQRIGDLRMTQSGEYRCVNEIHDLLPESRLRHDRNRLDRVDRRRRAQREVFGAARSKRSLLRCSAG